MTILWTYLAILGVTLVVYLVLYKHWMRITKYLIKQVDTFLFLFDQAICDQKDTIYDFETTKLVLFHNQQLFFSEGKTYCRLLPFLVQDIAYIEGILQKTIVPKEVLETSNEGYETWGRINTLKEYTHTILIILTLGICNLFLPR